MKGRTGVRTLLIGARLCRNLGGPSLLLATKSVLASFFPDAQFRLLTPLPYAEEDKRLAPTYGVDCGSTPSGRDLLVLAFAALLRPIGLRVGPARIQAVLADYEWADVVIDIWGIAFSDSLGSNSLRVRLASGIHLLVGRLLGKKVVKYTADYGPVRSRWNRLFARLYLNHCVDLILARDSESRDCLLALPIRTPIYVCPDTAFLMEPEGSEIGAELAVLRGRQPIVGLSVSHQAQSRHAPGADAYVDLMAQLADAVVDNLGGHVVVIPNELSDASDDDGRIANAVRERMTHAQDVTVVGSDWTAPQLKDIIGQCNAVIACRYHTLVAALSMGIPSLAIGWHHKYDGLLGLLGQERYVVDIQHLTLEPLLEVLWGLWARREDEAAAIRDGLPAVREGVMSGGKHVARLMSAESGLTGPTGEVVG